jgi:hypothetical protein
MSFVLGMFEIRTVTSVLLMMLIRNVPFTQTAISYLNYLLFLTLPKVPYLRFGPNLPETPVFTLRQRG